LVEEPSEAKELKVRVRFLRSDESNFDIGEGWAMWPGRAFNYHLKATICRAIASKAELVPSYSVDQRTITDDLHKSSHG
jgi:hypothetical protein